MQNLLDQQQQLALQDKKLLEEYKSEINGLKSLKIPVQDTQSEQPHETKNVTEEIKEVPRKWWQL